MYGGVGLRTTRGSGTNGYVATNLAALPKAKRKLEPIDPEKSKPVLRAPNLELLEHDRKREIELKLAEWAEENGIFECVNSLCVFPQLTPSSLPMEKQEEVLEKTRRRLTEEAEAAAKRKNEQNSAREIMYEGSVCDLHFCYRQEYRKYNDRRDQKEIQGISSHLQAKLRDEQREAFRNALGIRDEAYKEGDAFNEEVQERKKAERLKSRLEKEKAKLKVGVQFPVLLISTYFLSYPSLFLLLLLLPLFLVRALLIFLGRT